MGQNAALLNITADSTYIDQCYLNTERIRIEISAVSRFRGSGFDTVLTGK